MKKSVAVFFGGRSPEHDVSIITAHKPIIETLLADGGFEVWPVYISKDGSWYSNQEMNDLNFFKRDNYESALAKEKRIQLDLNDGLKIVWPGLMSKSVKIDIAFPSMHGTYGEDGSLMGLLRMSGIPFVGCDLFASGVAMDKVLTKQIASSVDIPVVPYVWFTKHDWDRRRGALNQELSNLKFPVFVKPVHLGSSIGISKVKEEKDLENAIEVAFHYDDKVLVEEGVANLIEVTLPIIGNTELEMGGVERPLNQGDFFDFNDKYISHGSKNADNVNTQYSEIPAKIDPELIKQVQDLGLKTYKVLGCAGIARVDFLIDDIAKKVYMNEVNTLPGSLYLHNWKKSGVSGLQLITKLIGFAEERSREMKDITHTFNSKVLQNANSIRKN